jgi:hypothetical protein
MNLVTQEKYFGRPAKQKTEVFLNRKQFVFQRVRLPSMTAIQKASACLKTGYAAG